VTTRTEALGQAQGTHRERGAWLVLAILLLFSVAAPLNQFKVPPIMPVLMAALGISVGRAGLLMSLSAVTGLVLALPSGLIFHKLGHRITGAIAGGSIVIGSALGAMSASFGFLLVTRAIEGAGTSFMAVLAPAIIGQWFVARRRGTAMGIWSAWVPLGQAMMLFLAPALAQATSWRVVWWLGAGYALVMTMVYLVFVGAGPEDAGGEANAGEGRAGTVLRNRDIWLLGVAFAFFNMAGLAFGTFMPTYLSTQRGLPLGQAALVASIATLVTIVSAPAGGLVSDRAGSRRRPYLVGFALYAIMLPLTGALALAPLVFLLVLMGLAIGLIPTNIFSAAVETAGGERQGGLAMAIIMMGQNAGALLGPIIFGLLVESAGGWPLAFASLAVMLLLGLVAGWLARVR
jgi:MFS family permease